uniref:Enhanced disease susceptibility 1 n=1 Tax=Vitis vinifera TaxID=29760 RepID=B2KL75_VITVI|nr:enhanced disease susceptibility 1 [Vitis vinifera]
MGETLGNRIRLSEEIVNRAASQAMRAHNSAGRPFLLDKTRGFAIFAFAGSWLPDDWFTHPPFGETKMDASTFPSLRSVGNDEVAVVNASFLRRFKAILDQLPLEREVQKVIADRRQVVFTGHSWGGAMAILATLYFLEKAGPNQNPPRCITFGSPLVGDRIFGHAVRREKWSDHFIHFVMRFDVIPRIMLGPASTEHQQILNFFNPRSQFYREPLDPPLGFYLNVMRSASSVAIHDACILMGCTNPLLETLRNFTELSPYRPFGTYIFCTGNGKLVVLKNPDAVLQILFYCAQLSQEEAAEIAQRSLHEHLAYENELQESLGMQNVVYLDSLEDLPLSSNGGPATVNIALNDLGLSPQARLCLRAAGGFENRRLRNQVKIDDNKQKINDELRKLKDYQEKAETRKLGYYDAFKHQEEKADFDANVSRLVLAGIWDEIIEMLRRYELPDEFENRKELIELATIYRRIVEPLDIANYYRHLKNEDTGTYVTRGRPKRYRYTQRWLEHAENKPSGSRSESCFWAELEELCIQTSGNGSLQDTKEKIQQLQKNVIEWIHEGSLGKDVLLEDSTFVKWWKTLPFEYKSDPESSRIANLIHG